MKNNDLIYISFTLYGPVVRIPAGRNLQAKFTDWVALPARLKSKENWLKSAGKRAILMETKLTSYLLVQEIFKAGLHATICRPDLAQISHENDCCNVF